MKISNLLKISALCCTVLCGVSNNTCNAGKSNYCGIVRQVFGEGDYKVKINNVQQNNSLLPCLNNVIIYNDEEAVLLKPSKIIHFYKEGYHIKKRLLNNVEKALRNRNINSIQGLKERLPYNYRFSERIKTNRMSGFKTLQMNNTNIENNQINNLIEDQQIIMAQHGIIIKVCEINNIFEDYEIDWSKRNNKIPVQVLLQQDQPISITNKKNIIFYKNGNVNSYYFNENDNDYTIGIDDLKSYILEVNEYLAEDFHNINNNNKNEKIKLAIKEAFGDEYEVDNL